MLELPRHQHCSFTHAIRLKTRTSAPPLGTPTYELVEFPRVVAVGGVTSIGRHMHESHVEPGALLECPERGIPDEHGALQLALVALAHDTREVLAQLGRGLPGQRLEDLVLEEMAGHFCHSRALNGHIPG